MVKGKTFKYLTPEFILSYISEYDIYRYYTGVDFKINRAFHSPLRNDGIPSFLIGNKFGSLYHIDFVVSEFRGNCFDFVMQKLGVNFPASLEIIAKDFGISSSGISSENRKVPQYVQPKKIKPLPTIIQVKPRKFNADELKYWSEYYQDIEDLKRENIYVPDKLYINKKKVPLNKNELTFCYLYNERYWKIYKPFANKKDKWKSNVPIDLADGLNNINNCDKAIVTKSKKDKMVLLKVYPCVCSVQNESVVALNGNTINHLKSNSKKILINYDSDEPGVNACLSVTKIHNFDYINVPNYYQKIGIKDYADLAKRLDIKAVEDHFKLKKIL